MLENIFKYLSTTDLTNCRLVCNDWSKEAWRAILQKKIYLRYYDPDSFRHSNTEDVSPLAGKFIPYQSAEYHHFFRYSNEYITQQVLFMSRYQHLMTDIVFNITGEDVSEMFEMLPKLRNLKSLRLILADNNSYETEIPSSCEIVTLPSVVHFSLNVLTEHFDRPGNIHDLLERLFLLLPNLTVISEPFNELSARPDDRYNKQILNVVTKTTVDLPKLQNLDFNMKLRTDAAIKCLMQKTFPLNKLDFTVCSTVDLQSIHSLLEHLSPTLENVTIRGATHQEDAGHPTGKWGDEVPDHGIPTTEEIFNWKICKKLNNLKRLEVIFMEGSLDFIHSLPNLKILKLESFHFGNKKILDNWNVHDLETLIIQCVEKPTCSLSFMERFLKQFPKLRHLDIDNLRNLPFSFTLMNFGKLKNLKLRGSRLDYTAIYDITKDGSLQCARQESRLDDAADAPISDTDVVPTDCLKGEFTSLLRAVHI